MSDQRLQPGGGALKRTKNLGDLPDVSAARTNLGLGDLAVVNRAALLEVPAGGSAGQVLTADGLGGYAWAAPAGGGDASLPAFETTAAMDAAELLLFDPAGSTGQFESHGDPGLRAIEVAAGESRLFVDFNADTSDYYETAGAIAKPAANAFSLFFVFRPETVPAGLIRLAGTNGGGATAQQTGTVRVDGGVLQVVYGDGSNYTITEADTTPIVAGNLYVCSIRTTAGSAAAEIEINGASQATTVTHGGTPATQVGGASQAMAVGRMAGQAANPPDSAIGLYWYGERLGDANQSAAQAAVEDHFGV